MKLSSSPILNSVSKSKTVLAILLSISLLATGCSAQWISIALADLPVLTQMALNIGTIITAAVWPADQPGGCRCHPEYLSPSQQGSESAGIALQPIPIQPERGRPAEDSESDRGH